MKAKSIIIIFACVLAAAFVLGLNGLVTLGEGTGQIQNGDRLIGILVTTEYLDLFDNQAYFEENIQQIMAGEAPESSAYQGRLYGQLVDRTDYDDDGNPIYSKEYAFPDVDGIFCYASRIDDGSGEPYITTGGDGVADPHLHINSSDDGEEVKYECVVCVDTNTPIELYFNPVYRTADGDIYAVSGDAFSYGGGEEGDVYGITLDEEYTHTENGEESTDRFSISVQTRYVYPAQRVRINQMDAENAVLLTAEYNPDNLPETFSTVAGAEYIVVESMSTDTQGKPETDRRLYQPEDISFEVFKARNDGVCAPVSVNLGWQ